MAPHPRNIPDENTGGVLEARRALAESRVAKRRTDLVITDVSTSLARAREVHAANDFTKRFRSVIARAAQ